MKESKIALIDGDSFLYRAGFAVEKTKYLVQGTADNGDEVFIRCDTAAGAKICAVNHKGIIWTRKEIGAVEDAIAVLRGMISKAVSDAGAVLHFVYLSPMGGNFRDALGKIRKYKGNRDNSARPVYYPDLRDCLLRDYAATVARGEEADDMISWVSRQMTKQGKEHVIVGIDKDLLQIPGDHYDWVLNEHKNLSDDEARLWYWAQVLAGDSGDNILGCWRLGVKKAVNFIAQCNGLSDDEMWPKIVRKYKESQKIEGCPYAALDAESVALETCRLVRLRQQPDEELWTPKLKEQKESDHGSRKTKNHVQST